MTKPQIIAFSDTIHFINTEDKILFYQTSDYIGFNYYLVDYRKKQLNDITKIKAVNPEKNGLTINDFPNLSEKNKKFIKSFNISSDLETIFIKWNEYIIIYTPPGLIAVLSNDKVLCKLIDEEGSYQTGDYRSYMYELGNGDLFIVNSGDVNSCIVFTINKPSVYMYTNHCKFAEDNYDEDAEDTCLDQNCPHCNSIDVNLTMDITTILEGKLIKNYKL